VPDFPPSKGLLFTAFEPSGDDHASVVIAELRRRHPLLPIYAWGGPKMEAAGATIVERTGDDAVMGMPGIQKIREHTQINKRIDAWLAEHRVSMLVPVDSPAANFPICKIARRHGIRITHLVAPQVWAWGKWRINKLRRRTDRLMCILPFEEQWFRERNIPATFIGHPLFDLPTDGAALDAAGAHLVPGSPKLAIMPGSRPKEIERNFPVQLDAFRRLYADFPQITGLIAATRPAVERRLRQIADKMGGWPDNLFSISGQTDAVVRWCDAALVVSGTVTLQIAKQRKPMVIIYKSNKLLYLLIGRAVVATRYFTLPNLIAGKRVVPELVPYSGDGEVLYREAKKLLSSPQEMQRQRDALDAVCRSFDGHHAGSAGADVIEQELGLATAAASV
jgi:lipid-A-disaccharide synthase